MTAVDDQTLVTRAKAGDFAAFADLVGRHEQRLYSLARYLLRHPEDAEDVVQNAFLKALEHLATFREEAAFGTWIARIVTNLALKHLTRHRRREGLSLEQLSEPDEDGYIAHPEYVADWRMEPSQMLQRQELQAVLSHAIDELPERLRLVFVLRDLEGLSIRETATALELSEANVKVRLLRARLALRERLTRVFGDPARQVAMTHHHDGGDRTAVAAVLAAYQQPQRADR